MIYRRLRCGIISLSSSVLFRCFWIIGRLLSYLHLLRSIERSGRPWSLSPPPASFSSPPFRSYCLLRFAIIQNPTQYALRTVSTSISSLTPSTNVPASSASGSATASAGTGKSGVSINTLVQSLFEGTLTNETRCLTCETVRPLPSPYLPTTMCIV